MLAKMLAHMLSYNRVLRAVKGYVFRIFYQYIDIIEMTLFPLKFSVRKGSAQSLYKGFNSAI